MLHINENGLGISSSGGVSGGKGKLSKGHVLVLARDRIAELEKEGEMLVGEGRMLMGMMDEWVRKGAGNGNMANMM